MSNIAIIGTGISGMAAAYLLHRAGHTITVYEKSPRIGGHTRTLNIDYEGKKITVDTGFIVFNYTNYPNLAGLFKHLDITVQKSDMTLAITVDQGRFEWGARNMNAVFGQRRNLVNPKFYRMIRDLLRFNRYAMERVNGTPGMSLRELMHSLRLGEDFMRYYLLPMGGAIWSCAPSTMMEFPARQFVQFFKNHGLLSLSGQHQWYTVSGGSQKYLEKLIAPFHESIWTDCGVTRVVRAEKGVTIADTRGNTHHYDRVVFACHADETLAMLADANKDEQELLGAFKYQRNIAYLHKDSSFMPKRKVCWSSWVYHADTRNAQHGEETHIGVTYWMNKLQSLDYKRPIFVTLNPTREITPEYVFDRHVFEHPIFDQAAVAAQEKLPLIQGRRGVWFCGAYTRNGFHEDGLLSAVKAAQMMGAEIPWQ